MITRFVMWWIHKQYLKHNKPIFFIKGTDKDYPRYLLYTENEDLHEHFDRV